MWLNLLSAGFKTASHIYTKKQETKTIKATIDAKSALSSLSKMSPPPATSMRAAAAAATAKLAPGKEVICM